MMKEASLVVPVRVESSSIPRISLRAGLWRYRNDRYGLLTELGDNRADIVESRLGSLGLVIVTEAGLARSVLAEHNDAFRKGPAMERHALPLLGDGLLTSMGAEHRRQRKVLAPRFTPRQIGAYAATMAELTRDMLERWRAGACSNDFTMEITGLTMAIAARTMFGAELPDEDVETLSEGLEVANRWVIKECTSLTHWPLSLPTARNRRMRRALAAMDAVVYRLIAEHRASERTDDVLSALLNARDEHGQGMDDQLVRDQVMTFFMAGHETIATTLSWAFHLLSRNPRAAAELAAEADAVLPEGYRSPRDIKALRGLSYAKNVLLEAMRLYPPIYVVGRQALRDVYIGGRGEYRIRSGTYVAINPLGLHRRPDYFADPEAFRPERHAGEGTWPRSAYLPFGAGPRVCIGNHFGTMEGMIVLALLAREIEFTGTRKQIAAEPLITLRPAGGVPFSVTWRRR